MKPIALITALALATGAGCAQDQTNLEKEVHDLSLAVKDLSAAVKTSGVGGGGNRAGGAPQPGAGQQRPARPQPDASKTYAISVDGDPFVKGLHGVMPALQALHEVAALVQQHAGDAERRVGDAGAPHPPAPS